MHKYITYIHRLRNSTKTFTLTKFHVLVPLANSTATDNFHFRFPSRYFIEIHIVYCENIIIYLIKIIYMYVTCFFFDFQDLALAYSKHVKPEDHSAYEEFIEGRNEVALDVGFVSTVVIPGSVRKLFSQISFLYKFK